MMNRIRRTDRLAAIKEIEQRLQASFIRALWERKLEKIELPKKQPKIKSTADAMSVRKDLLRLRKNLTRRIRNLQKLADQLNAVYTEFGIGTCALTEKLADLQAKLDAVNTEIERIMPTRRPKTIAKREDNVGFSLNNFGFDVVMAWAKPFLIEGAELTLDLFKDSQVVPAIREQGEQLVARLKDYLSEMAGKSFVVDEKSATVSRMQRSISSDIFGVDYDSKKPTDEWITVEHGIQELFDKLPWQFFGRTKKAGLAARDELEKAIECKLGFDGVTVVRKDGTTELYKGFAASASHQKDEKLVMAKASSLQKHEQAIWFTLAMQGVLQLDVNGAAIWKMRANILRPIRCKVETADGHWLGLDDIEMKPDIEVEVELDNARTVGDKDNSGNVFKDGPTKVAVKKADGTVISLVPLKQWGQITGYGIKGCLADATAPNKVAAELEGKPVNYGTKALVMGEGCWKFDKVGMTFDEFRAEVKKLAKQYPGIDKLYLLREADELEGQEKIRRLTRSLIQQWIHMSGSEIRRMTRKTRENLKRMKTLKGAIASLAEMARPEDQKSDLGKIFTAAPWLVLNPAIQQYLKTRFESRQREAAANKLRTTGCYPYIQEDLVAICQVWLYGADPARNDLGVLKAGEISVPGVMDGEEVLGVRFPANYQTAAIRVNKACKKAFASCPGVCMISYYDTILIRQDGDVDGDEMCIITDRLAITATKRMYEEFNPPIIVFAHGSKAPKKVIGTYDGLIKTMYEDLWKAKKFDGVGKYANLAMLCCHLASIDWAKGDLVKMNVHLNQMSLASTGAILSIDQVKGNAVSEDLIERLETIAKLANADAQEIWSQQNGGMECGINPKPFTQQFNKKDVSASACLGVTEALCDQIADFILRDTGVYEMDFGELAWNRQEAKRAMLTFGVTTTSFRESVMPKHALDRLGANWFNKLEGEDLETKALLDAGKPVSHTAILKMLWRNANALAFRMKGESLEIKRNEYYKVCREILYSMATGNTWVRSKDGYVFTDAEKKASVCNVCVSEALGLTKGWIVDEDRIGSYAIFVMKVFAKEILWSLKRNPADVSKFTTENAKKSFDEIVDEKFDEVAEVIAAEKEEDVDMSEAGYNQEDDEDLSVLDDGSFEMSDDSYDGEEPPIDF